MIIDIAETNNFCLFFLLKNSLRDQGTDDAR